MLTAPSVCLHAVDELHFDRRASGGTTANASRRKTLGNFLERHQEFSRLPFDREDRAVAVSWHTETRFRRDDRSELVQDVDADPRAILELVDSVLRPH